MEQLNYHKLVNLRKRFNKYDCDISKDIILVIEKHLKLEKEKSRLKDVDRRLDYQYDIVSCEFCAKDLTRKTLYQHIKNIHQK